MCIKTLKRLFAVLFILAFALAARSQQVHFVYLQTENGRPFYVKLNNKVVSSSTAGYLILPNLANGEYPINVGFPKNEFPEENFLVGVNNKNEGFLLKNFGEKGWGLFNLQSFAVMMGGGSKAAETGAKDLQSDPFSKMLAKVVKDSSILQKNEPIETYVAAPESDSLKADSSKVVALVPTTDSLKIASSNTVAWDSVSRKTESPSVSLSAATKLLSKRSKDGLEMIYVDTNTDETDTVRIFIPAEKETVVQKDAINHINNQKDTTGNIEGNIVEVPHEDKLSSLPGDSSIAAIETNPSPKSNSDLSPAFINDISSIKNADSSKQKEDFINKTAIVEQDSVKEKRVADDRHAEDKAANVADSTKEAITNEGSSENKMIILPGVVKSSAVNSDCKAFADNEDFLKLRKKMASESSDDNMIKAAKRVFHSKCFSTEQIKNLSLLFLTNSGKYRFFDEAYAFASDSNQYYTLQSQLTDSYYINRFKAMIHK